MVASEDQKDIFPVLNPNTDVCVLDEWKQDLAYSFSTDRMLRTTLLYLIMKTSFIFFSSVGIEYTLEVKEVLYTNCLIRIKIDI